MPTHFAESDHPKEECGVVGLYCPHEDAVRNAFFALFALQHRGQESAGLAASDGENVRMDRRMGLVANVFNEDTLKGLPGNFAIGHTRYSTTGKSTLDNAQPVWCPGTVLGTVAVAHNGNLINAKEMRAELVAEGVEFSTTSDSEILARYLVKHLPLGPEEAVRRLQSKARGAYSCTVLLPNMILGFRDPHGIRPLMIGTLGDGYMVASESCAFGPIGAVPTYELEPGEIVIIDKSGMRVVKGVQPEAKAMCLFEFIYFARPDSEMYGTLLYDARERMGMELALEHSVEADIVVPVPDSGIPAALGYSKQSGLPFVEGMMKSRYIHRTFIEPDQRMRERGVRMKLTPLVQHLKGKRIVLVDDSIVRGTTTGELVKMLFDAGAAEVHVRITAPPITWPCYYGIDMAKRKDLIAANLTIEQLTQHIGATSLGYLSLAGCVRAVGRPQNEFCTACFSGFYPIPISEDQQKEDLEPTSHREVGEMGTYPAQQPTLINV